MKKLNTKSDLYYINKIVTFKLFNISKVHLIDDDCNEFIATVTGFVSKGYSSPKKVRVIDYEDYSSKKWDSMIYDVEYEKAVVI